MKVVEKSIKAIHPYANNPRKNDDAVEQVANSIREFGFKVPIILAGNMAGKTTWKQPVRKFLLGISCGTYTLLTSDTEEN